MTRRHEIVKRAGAAARFMPGRASVSWEVPVRVLYADLAAAGHRVSNASARGGGR